MMNEVENDSEDDGKITSARLGGGDEDVVDEEDGDDEEEEPYRDPPPGMIRIRPSKFNYIPGTIFIEYPPELGITRSDISKLEKLGRKKLHYSCYWGRNCIKNAFRRAGFENSDSCWTAMWSKHQTAEVIGSMNCLQKVNHFPSSWCIGRKDRLQRTIQAMTRLHGEEFSFHPEGFTLPKEGGSLERCLRNDGPSKSTKRSSSLWIVKPPASSCGRGIRVITAEKALQYAKGNKKMLLQRYLADPYLINGNKFDLRIYVLVAGVDPLRIYIHEEGLTRISTHAYSLKNIKDRFAHLTNYSINKKSSLFVAATEAVPQHSPRRGVKGKKASSGPACASDDMQRAPVAPAIESGEHEGFKWSLKAFRKWLSDREGVEVANKAFRDIDDVVVKTIIAAEPELTHSLHSAANYRTNCFELFGFDIFLDKHLTPHLIEVNISPSLMGSSPLDKRIKGTLISDACHVVGFHSHDPSLLAKYSRLESKGASGIGGSGAKTSKYKSYSSSGGETSKPSTSAASSGGGVDPSRNRDDINPFSFNSLSKMMGQQDLWRRDPCPANIDIDALGNGDSSWLMLLMVEDEFGRAESSKFRQVHPAPDTLEKYLSFYKTPRFSDHLLGLWTLRGMSENPTLQQYIPDRFTIKPIHCNDTRKMNSDSATETPRPLSVRRPLSAGTRRHNSSRFSGSGQISQAIAADGTAIVGVKSSRPEKIVTPANQERLANVEADATITAITLLNKMSREGDGDTGLSKDQLEAEVIGNAVNATDLRDKLGLGRQRRKSLSSREAVTHSSSPMGRRNDSRRGHTKSSTSGVPASSTPRSRSGSRSRAGGSGLGQRLMLDRQQRRGSSLGPPSMSSTRRGSSVEGSVKSKTAVAVGTRAVESLGGDHAPEAGVTSQKYRPIGRQNRLRQQVSHSRYGGLVFATDENLESGRNSAGIAEKAAAVQPSHATLQTTTRVIAHSPISDTWRDDRPAEVRKEAASIRASVGVPPRMVPYRPRSAASSTRRNVVR